MCFYSIERKLIGLADSPVELVDSVDFLAQWASEVSWEIICYVMTIIFSLQVITRGTVKGAQPVTLFLVILATHKITFKW